MIITGCKENNPPDLTSQVDSTLKSYRNAWLSGDAENIMRHLADDAMLFRPTKTEKPLKGKEEITAFWFPGSSVSYPVYNYTIENQQITANGNLAVAQGISRLSWYTLEEGIAKDSTTSHSEFITILVKEKDEWKIYRQMYNMKELGYSH